VLGAIDDGRVQIVANFDPVVAGKVSAGDVVKRAAALVGGSGGGRPTMARAGGKEPDRLPEALAEAERLLAEAL
jgi:alanyl-tRNA synthetase